MTSLPTPPEVKRIGETGQVSVGKALAGKLVRVEPGPEGVMLRFVVDVPEENAWWLQEPHKTKLQEALAWAAKHGPAESDLGELLERVKGSPSAKKVPAVKRAKRATAAKRATRKKRQVADGGAAAHPPRPE